MEKKKGNENFQKIKGFPEILNELKETKNVILIRLRGGQKEGLSLERSLGQDLGIDERACQEIETLPSSVLFGAIERIHDSGDQPIVIFEDLHTFIGEKDYNKERKAYILPDEIRSFLNQCMQKVADNKAHVILTISELGKKNCFGQLSGSDRLDFHRFVRVDEKEVYEMLLKVKVLEKFGNNKELAAKLLSEKIGGDMGPLMRALAALQKARFDAKDSVEEIITQSLPYPHKFSEFMLDRVLRDSSGKLHHEAKKALMAELLLRCSSKSKKGSLLLNNTFFRALAEEQKRNWSYFFAPSQRTINGSDLDDSIHVLERENLFLRISDDAFNYEPHKRLHVEEWKKWISAQDNQEVLNATRQAFLSQEKVEFPQPAVVDSVCQRFFGEKR